ncbi:MAG: hypothetical protein Q9204_001973 [Flavoplaca sp. TL-2023a]
MDFQNTSGLVIRNNQSRGGSGLPNQGQIDWVALANTTVSASVGVLSRLSGAGVDPFTVAVGQAVASKFQMSRLGIHRLESAVNNLGHASMIGDALWFGFGIDHIIRSLMRTTEGATCVMLCSILSESRTSVLSARVLFELTNTYSSSSPDATRLTPSLQQWEALVKACAGTLSTTPFGTVVDQMVMLVSQHIINSPTGSHRRYVGDPERVAAVLNALGRLSLGQLVTLTISGGCDCGWIAAVAYWFFDIAVEIRNIDGQVVYPLDNRPDASRRTLVVVQTMERSCALQMTSEAYTVPDITMDIIVRDEASMKPPMNSNDLHSRVPWQSVLRQTFGRQASTLLRLKVDLGTAVGSAARIFLEYAKPLDELEDWPSDWKASDFICVLFTGYDETMRYGTLGCGTMAFVKGGLCFYLGVLAKLSDKPEEMHHTFIIPGCMETKTGRIYDTLGSTQRFDVPVFAYDAAPAVPCVELPTMPRFPRADYEISHVVEEAMLTLTSHFIVKKSSGTSVVCSPYLQECPKLDITGLSVATIGGEGRFEDHSLTKAGCKIGLRLVGDNPISRLLALLVDEIYEDHVPPEVASRSRRRRIDDWLDPGAEYASPMYSGSYGSAQDNLEDDELHAVEEVDEGNSSPPTPYALQSDVMLQRDECLSCAIRKAVRITGEDPKNVYIICRGRQ